MLLGKRLWLDVCTVEEVEVTRPIQVGCIGAGGYASFLLQRFDQFIPRRRARVAAVRTSRPEAVARDGHIISQGPRLVRSVKDLLAMEELDGVIVPTSIDTHLPYTPRQAMGGGKHLLCGIPGHRPSSRMLCQ